MDNQKEITVTHDDSKSTIRSKIWEHFEANKLSGTSWPVHKRIPNFKESKDAADKLRELEIFKSANVVKIDPDKPLQHARYHALEDGKTCLVPVPRLSSYFMNKIQPSDDSKINWSCSSKGGLLKHSNPIELDKEEKVDLIVVGAVAVSPKGWRIGKGMGFSDLEYAMMSILGFVNDDVKIVALVHDCQVIEDLSENIFGQHDVPVDLIVTPTRVIECQGTNKPRPSQVYWSLLTKSQLASIPALRKLRYIEWQKGNAIQNLQDEAEAPGELEDVELSKPQRSHKVTRGDNEERLRPTNLRQAPRRFRGSGRRFINGARNEERPYGPRKSYGQSRKSNVEHDGSGDTIKENENEEIVKDSSSRKIGFHERKPRGNKTFSTQDAWLYVGNIPWNIRVSEFKQQVREAIQMQPLRVVWKGPNGFAFLSFAKSLEANEALSKLNGMKVLNRELKVELAQKRDRKPSERRRDNKESDEDATDVKVEEISKAVEDVLVIEEEQPPQ